MKKYIYIYELIILLSSAIKLYKSLPTISLEIFNDNFLFDEIKLNFLFYMRYSSIISKKEFSPIYKISYISKDSTLFSIIKEKDKKHILLFDSYKTFSNKKTSNISNIIIFPDKYMKKLNKELFKFFDLKQYIFFVEQEQFDNLIKFVFFKERNIYARISIPPEISKDFLNKENVTISEYYFIVMFLSFILFFMYLFHYNFIVPLLYKDFWLFFISQFYLFIPLRFIVLLLLSIKLIIIQNIRGLLPSSPGFFVILAVQKSLIKTNMITIILLANEGLYIFENMTKIIRKMNIYQIQFLFITVILILLLSFPYHFITVLIDLVLCPFFAIHSFINYRQLIRTLKITLLCNKRYIPYIKFKLSIWKKQNILLVLYFMSLILVYIYSRYSTNEMLLDEIVCLKSDMLTFSSQNIFLFVFCVLYRPRNLERKFFIVYTEKFGNINLKFFLAEADNNIRNKFVKKTKNKLVLNMNSVDNIRKEHINKPIIVLNPKLFLRKKIVNQQDNKFNIMIGNVI